MANEKTLQLDALLKSSPEVSSLGGNDRILAVDGNGEMRRISRSNLDSGKSLKIKFPLSISSGWVRIGRFDSQGNVLLYCGLIWGVATPNQFLLSASAHVNGNESVNRVINLMPSKVFTKARLVKKADGAIYLDIYFYLRPGALIITDLAGFLFNFTEPIFNPSIEASDTTWASDLSGGGKNRCQTDSYILLSAFVNHFEERRTA